MGAKAGDGEAIDGGATDEAALKGPTIAGGKTNDDPSDGATAGGVDTEEGVAEGEATAGFAGDGVGVFGSTTGMGELGTLEGELMT